MRGEEYYGVLKFKLLKFHPEVRCDHEGQAVHMRSRMFALCVTAL